MKVVREVPLTKRQDSSRKLLLRADAGLDLGYGHVMRCLTLGLELQVRGWHVVLLSMGLDEFLHDRAISFGFDVRDLSSEVGSLRDAEEVCQEWAELVVIDGYDFSHEFFETLDHNRVRYVVIDDTGATAPQGAFRILNQNPHATRSLYPHFDLTRLLLGSDFALVRPEVTAIRKFSLPQSRESTPKILVSIGGTDIGGLTQSVTEALSGGDFRDVAASLSNPPAGVARAPRDIAQDLAESTVAIIGAGGTLWEACCLGVPAVALIVAENQIDGSQKAASLGACVTIDCINSVDVGQVQNEVSNLMNSPQRRLRMSNAGRKLIDGCGGSRVAEALCEAVSP